MPLLHTHCPKYGETGREEGRAIGSWFIGLSTTFSRRVATDTLRRIEELSPRAKDYLEEIPISQWRNIAWLDNPCLPTRFGIVTSNMSESSNSMFEEARTGSWLSTLDKVLGKMFERISSLRARVKGKSGIVEGVVSELRKNWEACAGYRVIQVDGADTVHHHATT